MGAGPAGERARAAMILFDIIISNVAFMNYKSP